MSRGSRYSRRDFLSRLGLAGSGAAIAGSGSLSRLLGAANNPPLPAPEASGIEHVVVVMMENRSSIILSGGYRMRMAGRQG
jgi:phospholipase C